MVFISCGTSRKLWELLIPTGIGTFGPDNVEDMAEAKEILGPYMCIQGNVPPVEVMRLGTPYDGSSRIQRKYPESL